MSEEPLAGLGVLVTRPAHLSQSLAAGIAAAGGQVILLPAIDIVGRDPVAVAADLAAIARPDIVVYVSRNAVDHGPPALLDSAATVAAVGPATKAAIESRGRVVDIVPDNGFDSEALLKHPRLQDVGGQEVLIVRGQSGRELLADTLRGRGAKVTYLAVYERRPHKPLPEELSRLDAALKAESLRFLIVLSADSLRSLTASLPQPLLESLRSITLVAPSPRVLQTASELIPGIETALASGPQAPDIVDTLTRLAQSGQDA